MRPRFPMAFAIVLLAGCGGTGGVKTAKGHAAGAVRIAIRWPARSDARVIPLATDHITLTFRLDGTVAKTVDIARPVGGDTTSTTVEIREGFYDVTAEALSNVAGSAPLATATQSLGILPKESASLDLAMSSTVTKVVLSKPSGTVRIGRTIDIVATAQDSAGRTVLVAPAKWQWRISNSAILGGTAMGDTLHLKGLSLGSASIDANELEGGMFVDGDFTVLDAPTISPKAWAGEGSVGYTHYLDTPAVGSTTKAIGQNFVYFTSTDKDGNIFTEDGHGILTSFTATGAQRWQKVIGGAFFKLVVLSDGSAIATGIEGTQPFVRAYKGEDGTVLWNKNFDDYGVVGYSLIPTPDGKLVYIHGGSIDAIDAADGSAVWSTPGFGAKTLSCGSTGLLAATGDSVVNLIDTASGQSAGQLESLPFINGVPIVTKDSIYVSAIETGNVRNLIAYTLGGTRKWETEISSNQQPSADKDGNVFAATPNGADLMKLRASDGAVLWTYPGVGLGIAPVVDGAGNVYAMTYGSGAGNFDAVSISSNGTKRWQVPGALNANDGNTMALGPNGTLYLTGAPFTQVK